DGDDGAVIEREFERLPLGFLAVVGERLGFGCHGWALSLRLGGGYSVGGPGLLRIRRAGDSPAEAAASGSAPDGCSLTGFGCHPAQRSCISWPMDPQRISRSSFTNVRTS